MADGNGSSGAQGVARVMVGTDRSQTAERAVQWAAAFARRLLGGAARRQVVIPVHPADTEHGTAEVTRARAAAEELQSYATQVAGERGRAHVVIDDASRPGDRARDRGARHRRPGRRQRRDGGPQGVPARQRPEPHQPQRAMHRDHREHDARRRGHDGHAAVDDDPLERGRDPDRAAPDIARHQDRDGLRQARVSKELFGRPDADGAVGRRRQAKRLRSSLEELGPTFAKIGQILSTRPDLMPPEFIEELATLQDNVPPLTEEQVVRVMEQELGVPWEDVFETIDPLPLAAGTIAQVHRATLADHTKAVVKVQRPDAKEQIEQDLALLEVFAEKVADRPGLKQVVDMKAVFDHLSESLHRELDFRREAENIERMGSVIEDFSRLRGAGGVRGLLDLAAPGDAGHRRRTRRVGAQGPARKEAARQLLESFYKQILVDGFFHADPHPGT